VDRQALAATAPGDLAIELHRPEAQLHNGPDAGKSDLVSQMPWGIQRSAGPSSHAQALPVKAALSLAAYMQSTHRPVRTSDSSVKEQISVHHAARSAKSHTEPLNLSVLALERPAPVEPFSPGRTIRQGRAQEVHHVRDYAVETVADQPVPLPTEKDAVSSLPQAVENVSAARPGVSMPVGQESLLVAGEHEGTTVSFVLEDWQSEAPVRSIRITLEPRDLGELRIALQHRNGQVHARMIVENAQALNVVQAQATALQQALAEKGMHFGSFSVTVANNAAWTGLSVLGTSRPAQGDADRKDSNHPRRARRDEVKTT